MAYKIRILYIDDNAGDRALVRDSLEKEHGGFSLTLAKSRKEFENLIAGESFDLILTDFNISGFEGLQVLETVQDLAPGTPVIIVTGTGSEEIAVKALKKGAADYIIKTPQHITRLPNTINTILGKNRLEKERENNRRELSKMNQVYVFISHINQLIVRVHDRDKLLREACEIAVAIGKFRMAWVGSYEKDTDLVRPYCWAGHEDGYLSKVDANQNTGISDGKGPVRTAMSEGDYFICNDIEHDPIFSHWREEALKRGYHSSISLPIKEEGQVTASYNVYSEEPGFFDQGEIDLFKEVVSDISFALDSIRADKIRREAEEELQRFYDEDISGDYISMPSGEIIQCNRTFVKILGYQSEKELLQHNMSEFYPSPEVREAFLDNLKRKKRLEFYESKLIARDGREITVLENAIGTFDDQGNLVKIRGYIVNITERIKALSEIRKLSRAIEQSPETIIITDKDGNIEYINPTFTRVTGYRFQEIAGENPRILSSHEKSQKDYKELWQTIMSGKVWRGEFHDKKKNGELYWEQASISPIFDEKGEITHFVAVKEDITERKAKDLALKMALERAQESDRLKSAFLANMSHEIRTPMNGILGFAELLKEPRLQGKEQKEYISIIERSANRMLNIITDIVNISKIEAGQMDVYISESHLNQEIDYLFSFFKLETEKKKIRFSCHKGLSDSKALIETDREKVSSILTNLIKNATKFTPEGSIEFGYEKKGNFLEFYVKDTGIGITDKNKKIVFERFRRGNESRTRNYEGSGLGLAISKAYVEMLGGKIWFESTNGTKNHGTAFYFTIPYQVKAKEPDKKEKTLQAHDEIQSEKKLKILIVEDDEVSEMLLKNILKSIAKEMFSVDSGLKAVETCRNNPDIDVIMMDIRIPELDGYTATRQIREFNKEVLIIAQTAFALEGDREKAIQAGCNDYITKPIELEKFQSVLAKFKLK